MSFRNRLLILFVLWTASGGCCLKAKDFSWNRPAPDAGAERAFAFSELEFNGILLFGDRSKFAFAEKRSGRTFWVREGETIGGLLVDEFDAERGIAFLSKAGARQSYHLTVSSGPISTYDIATRNLDRQIEENLALDMAVSYESGRRRLEDKRREDRERRIALQKMRQEAEVDQ